MTAKVRRHFSEAFYFLASVTYVFFSHYISHDTNNYLFVKSKYRNSDSYRPAVVVTSSPWNRVVYRICGTISLTYAVCPRDLGCGRWETTV